MKYNYLNENRKVAIIGTGFVGSSIAYALSLRDIAREIVFIDVNTEKSVGEAWDIRHGLPAMGTANLYAGDYSDCAGCNLIIITAGRNRRPGETRLQLVDSNVQILRSVVDSIQPYYTGSVVLIVSNPVDILTHKAAEWMDLPNGRVFGTGCLLDTSRFIRLLADHIGISTGVVNGYLVGEHGDSQVPIWSRVTVGAIPIEEYCRDAGILWDESIRQDIADRTRAMGQEIIQRKGKTHFGIATCVSHLADAILNQKPTIASVCSPLMGEHGVRNVTLSVPSVVGPAGVQMRIREHWAPEEYRGFFDAVDVMRNTLSGLTL